MPQAQPELKKVRYTPYNHYLHSTTRAFRRTRQHEKNCDGKDKKEKWTDPRLQYLDKRLFVQLNGSRKVIGVLRGYDVSFPILRLWSSESIWLISWMRQVFLNIVLDDAVEEKDGGEKVRLGMVVRVYSRDREEDRLMDGNAGHSRQLSRHARGFGENRWRTRRQRIEKAQITNGHIGRAKRSGLITAFARHTKKKQWITFCGSTSPSLELLPILLLKPINHRPFKIFDPTLDTSFQN